MYKENIAAEEIKDTNPQDSQVVNNKPKKRLHFNWKKFIGYFVLGLVVLGIGYLGYRFYEFKPYRVIVSNVTSRSATISWVTDSAEPGMVVYKEGNTVLPIWISKYGMGNGYDDRDYSNAELEAANKTQENISESKDITAEDIETEIVVTELGRYWSHHVTIRNLDPETEYEFMVGDGLVFEKANTVDTKTTKVSTLTDPESVETPIPAYGIVRYYYDQENGEDITFLRANDAMVYAYLRDEVSKTESEYLSSITNDEGGWYLDLSSAYTSDGENFFDALGTAEATDVNLYFTVEGVGFGRWTIIKNLEDIAPSDSFDLVNPESKDDSDLDFQGYSFGSEDDSLVNSLINKVNAKAPTNDEAANEAYQKYIKETKTWQAPGTTAYGGSSKESVGTCRGDVCKGSGTCGWVNDLDCKCVCSGEVIDIAPGTSCKCSSDGRASSTGTEQKALSESDGAYCSNDTSKSDKGCWSATNGCWYSTDHVAQNGLKCTSDHRWIDPEDPITDYTVVVVGNDTTGTDSNKKCCGFPAGANVWKNLGLYDSCEGSFDDLTGKVAVCNGTYNSNETLSEVCCGFPAGSGSWKNLETYNSTCPDGYDNLTGIASTCEGSYTTTTLSSPICCAMYFSINNKWSLFPYGASCPSGSIPYTVSLLSDCTGYLNADEINTTADVDTSTRCEDSFSYDLVSSSSAEGFYYNCGKNEVYEQKEYKDKTSCANNTFFIGGYCCDEMKAKHSFMSGKYVKCSSDNVWVEVTKDDISKILTYAYDILEANETCDTSKYEYCYCPLSDEIFYDSAKCVKLSQSTSLVKSVFASTDNQYTYLIDTENSMLQNLTPGIYSFNYNNESYIFEVSEYEYIEAGGEFSLYIDVNKDGVIDDTDINVTNSSKTIKLTAIKKGFNYSLQEGFNFVSFPFIFKDEDIQTASDLLEYLNNRYNNVFYSISKYDSGKWVMVGGNEGTYDQNDFQLIPGQGYVLKTRWDVDITLYGNEITYDSSTDSAPIYLSSGWNLVGLYGTGVKSYTAESILKDITDYEDINFTAVNVSRWVESRALYEALQRDTDGTVYGLDFPIELKKSYFIKVTDGEGNWEPGIE